MYVLSLGLEHKVFRTGPFLVESGKGRVGTERDWEVEDVGLRSGLVCSVVQRGH